MSFCALTAANVHKASTAAVSLFLFFICFPSHLFLSERTIVFSTMAGLLTFPQSALPSQPCLWPVTFSKQTLCLRGLQLQVQFRILTGFPCIEMALSHPITINFGAKVIHSFPTTNKSAKIFQNKKEKGPETHWKTMISSAWIGSVILLVLSVGFLRKSKVIRYRSPTTTDVVNWWQ